MDFASTAGGLPSVDLRISIRAFVSISWLLEFSQVINCSIN